MSRTLGLGIVIASCLAVVGSCRADAPTRSPTPAIEATTSPGAETLTSLLGEPLQPAPMAEDVRAQREAHLEAARMDHRRDPSLDTTIWLGRRTAYLGRYSEAIGIYTQGLQDYGEQSRLLRHRGHRYITARQFERARSDLQRAAELVQGKPDAVEVDGLPNAAGVPTGTQHTNIYYHLGLSQFLLGDFDAARASYEACLAASTTDDMRVATSHWLYMTLRRLGDDAAAAAVLEPIHADMKLYENFSYLRLLLLYKGEVSAGDLIAPDASDIDRATLGFGLGHWHLVSGDERRALEIWRAVVETPQWAAFGYIAAEAELHRRAS